MFSVLSVCQSVILSTGSWPQPPLQRALLYNPPPLPTPKSPATLEYCWLISHPTASLLATNGGIYRTCVFISPGETCTVTSLELRDRACLFSGPQQHKVSNINMKEYPVMAKNSRNKDVTSSVVRFCNVCFVTPVT